MLRRKRVYLQHRLQQKEEMKRNLLIAKAILAAVILAGIGCARGMATGVDRPKLVVGIVVDQMRWDYLYRYYGLYGEGGFKRMMREGYNCENTMINYVPTVTAVGHRTDAWCTAARTRR